MILSFLITLFLSFSSTQTSEQDFSPEERAEMKQIFQAMSDARTDLRAAEARLLQFLKDHKATAPSLPDDPVDVPAPGPIGDLAPPVPSYRVPSLADCAWTIADGVASSTKGLDSISGRADLIGPAYRASIAAGHPLPITIGVWDNAGAVTPGGSYNPKGDRSISIPDGAGGYLGVSIEIVGLDDSCEVMLGWTTKWGRGDYIGAFNIGLRGPDDSFIIRANDGVGRLIIDGCWWLAYTLPDGSPQNHASGMHIDKWETLIWANHKWRGENPEDPGTLVREHSAYLKSCVGTGPEAGTWIVGNDLRGGNRTGFQIRPDPTGQYANPRPTGPIVIADNYADGYGWTHDYEDGGGCLTVWVGPESPVYVYGNTITDARYACLVVSGQLTGYNYLNAAGFPISNVHVYDNTFENSRSKRECVMLSAAESVDLYTNAITGGQGGDVAINSAWNMKQNGIAIGSFRIHGQAALDAVKALRVSTWDPSTVGGSMPMQPETLDGFLVQ